MLKKANDLTARHEAMITRSKTIAAKAGSISVISLSVPATTNAVTMIDLINKNPTSAYIVSAMVGMAAVVVIGSILQAIVKQFNKGDIAGYMDLAMKSGCLAIILGIITTVTIPVLEKLF